MFSLCGRSRLCLRGVDWWQVGAESSCRWFEGGSSRGDATVGGQLALCRCNLLSSSVPSARHQENDSKQGRVRETQEGKRQGENNGIDRVYIHRESAT